MSLSSTQILILSLSSVALYCEHATRFQTDSVPVMVLHHSTITLSVDMLKAHESWPYCHARSYLLLACGEQAN